MFPPDVRSVRLYEGSDFRVNSEIGGSLEFCALMVFMCSGSSLYVECILPFGMLFCVCGE